MGNLVHPQQTFFHNFIGPKFDCLRIEFCSKYQKHLAIIDSLIALCTDIFLNTVQ